MGFSPNATRGKVRLHCTQCCFWQNLRVVPERHEPLSQQHTLPEAGSWSQLTIREIVEQILRGQIRIPAFQRGFVWEPDRVAYLMDSIYKKYPFGSLLFWRTREQLSVERDLGPFKLPAPKEDYPVDYVLDGQQRITSIFGVFQRDLEMTNPGDWQNVYFDLKADRSVQDTQFFALPSAEVDSARHFPLNTIFDTVAYRQATERFDDPTKRVLDEMQSVFKEVRIPLQVFRTEEKATVAIIFERVNRQGVPLDTLQLLSAWTWSEEFQLQEQFGDLAEQLSPFGFADVGGDTEPSPPVLRGHSEGRMMRRPKR